VLDAEAPVVTGLAATPSVIWPANHNMVDVMVGYALSDNCGGACTLTVSSNEPANGAGDGNTSPDWVVIDSHHVQLSRRAFGSGLRPDLHAEADLHGRAGNATVKSTTVSVPHNR
jgi:hypothetical protein